MTIAKSLSALGLLIVAALATFYWNEAKNEVVFLCTNFEPGVSQSNVLAQLDTAELASYQVENRPGGSRITFSSALNFDRYTCVIETDPDGQVVAAGVR